MNVTLEAWSNMEETENGLLQHCAQFWTATVDAIKEMLPKSFILNQNEQKYEQMQTGENTILKCEKQCDYINKFRNQIINN